MSKTLAAYFSASGVTAKAAALKLTPEEMAAMEDMAFSFSWM